MGASKIRCGKLPEKTEETHDQKSLCLKIHWTQTQTSTEAVFSFNKNTGLLKRKTCLTNRETKRGLERGENPQVMLIHHCPLLDTGSVLMRQQTSPSVIESMVPGAYFLPCSLKLHSVYVPLMLRDTPKSSSSHTY